MSSNRSAETEENPSAALLIIGNEILSGRTQDLNLSYLAQALTKRGITLKEARVVEDRQGAIVEAVNSLRQSHDYLFTSGGIGPTHDDITVEAIAHAFGVPVIVHPEALQLLKDYYQERATESRLRMARTPEGAGLVDNPVSGAPGIRMENVFVLAGVPGIFQAMVDEVVPGLQGGKPVVSRNITVDAAESDISELLRQVQDRFLDEVDIGSYPFLRDGRYGVTIVVRSRDEAAIDAAISEVLTGLTVMKAHFTL